MKNNKKRDNPKDAAAMPTSKLDELNKLYISSPATDMSLLMQMLAQPKNDQPDLIRPILPENLGIPKISIPDYLGMPQIDIVRDKRKESKRQNNERRERLNLSDEQRCKYFAKKQKQYEVEVDKELLKLDEWSDDIDLYEHRTPNEQDISLKFDELNKQLKQLEPRFNPNDLFKNGPEDTALCGRLLIKKEEDWDDDEEQEAVCLMSALQWLVRMKNELPAITVSDHEESMSTPPPSMIKEEDTETAELLILLDNSGINIETDQSSIILDGKSFSQGQTLIAIMQKYQDEGKEWAKNPSKFSHKIVLGKTESTELSPNQQKKADAISKRMRRAKKDIGNARLKDLSAESIRKATESSLKGAQVEYDKWDGLYLSVQKILDTVRRCQADKNGQERTEMDRNGLM